VSCMAAFLGTPFMNNWWVNNSVLQNILFFFSMFPQHNVMLFLTTKYHSKFFSFLFNSAARNKIILISLILDSKHDRFFFFCFETLQTLNKECHEKISQIIVLYILYVSSYTYLFRPYNLRV